MAPRIPSNNDKPTSGPSKPAAPSTAFDETDLGKRYAKYDAERTKLLEDRLFTTTDKTEKQKIRDELAAMQAQNKTHGGISRLEDGGYCWYYREGDDAYSILKKSDAARQYESLKYEEDKKRFIKDHHDHHFVVGEGFDDSIW